MKANASAFVVDINKEKTIVEGGPYSEPSFNPQAMFNALPEGIIDKTTLRLIQVGDLHRAVDHTETAIGSAVLFRSLMQPPTSLEFILEKQNSLREIESDDSLRQAIEDYVGEIKDGERALLYFLNNQLPSIAPYGPFKAAMKAGKNLALAAKSIPRAESQYLSSLVETINSFDETTTHRLMRGPIYRTLRGLKPKEEVGFFTPAWRFRPSRMTIASCGPPGLAGALITGIETGIIERGEHLAAISVPLSMVAPLSIMYGLMMKPSIDDQTAMHPMWKKTLQDQGFKSALDAAGSLDELLSFAKYGKAMSHETTIPRITDDEVHYFEAENMRNPVQAKNDPFYVPNDVNLNGHRLTFITGPNSAVKTHVCRTISQNQILGQIGGRVVASRAAMNVADMIAYQAPMFDTLQDEEGRFGTELKITRDIFYRATPKSLVILDELSEGTTSEEKMHQSKAVLDGFYAIGNNTLLVSHNHALADAYRERQMGQFLQGEFNGKIPTHRVIPGISRNSHADRVAKKIGFSKEDIQRHLRKKGYIS